MDNKTILIVASILVGAFALMYLGRANVGTPSQGGAQGGPPSELLAQETFYNFGVISMANGNVEKTFSFRNQTDKDIKLESIVTSCMCTSAYLITPSGKQGPFKMPGMGYVPPAEDTLKPGETREVQVVYNPNAHGPAGVGPIDRFVYVVDASGGTLVFEIKAVVTP